MNPPICPCCNNPAKLVTGKTMYPHRPDLAHKKFWACRKCDAYVGCHPNTDVPLGNLATRQVRQARSAAHFSFDKVWRGKRRGGMMSRGDAYKWLAGKMGLCIEKTHIGMFDVAQCTKVMDLVAELRRERAA